MFMPDPTEKEPLYLQIKNEFKDKILKGHYKPGDKLPSEQELSEMLNVSTGTLRKALAELEMEGFIYRKQRLGTFVTETVSSVQSFSEIGIISFTMNGGRLGESTIPIVEGIELADTEQKYNLHVSRMRGTSILESRNRRLKDSILEKSDCGWISVSPLPLSDIEFLLSRKVPFISALNDYINPFVPSICFDQVLSGYQITKDLLSWGYRDIRLILDRVGALEGAVIRGSDMFLEGYQSALMEFDIPYDTRKISLSNRFGLKEELKPKLQAILKGQVPQEQIVLVCGRGANVQFITEIIKELGFSQGKDIHLVFVGELLNVRNENLREIGCEAFRLLNNLMKVQDFSDINLKVRLKLPYDTQILRNALANTNSLTK